MRGFQWKVGRSHARQHPLTVPWKQKPMIEWKLALGAWAALGMTVALAQQPPPRTQSPMEVLKNAQQNAGDIGQLRAALQSPDPSVRASAFTSMIESNNPSLIAMAINEGHVSSDAAVRDLAARAAFRELRAFQIEPDGDVSPDTQNAIIDLSDERGLRVVVADYNWVTGIFTNFAGQGQISGSRLTFRTQSCQGTLPAKEGSWMYDGLVICVRGATKLSSRMHISIR